MLIVQRLVISFTFPPRPVLIFAALSILVLVFPIIVVSILARSFILGRPFLVPQPIVRVSVAVRTVLVVSGTLLTGAAV